MPAYESDVPWHVILPFLRAACLMCCSQQGMELHIWPLGNKLSWHCFTGLGKGEISPVWSVFMHCTRCHLNRVEILCLQPDRAIFRRALKLFNRAKIIERRRHCLPTWFLLQARCDYLLWPFQYNISHNLLLPLNLCIQSTAWQISLSEKFSTFQPQNHFLKVCSIPTYGP